MKITNPTPNYINQTYTNRANTVAANQSLKSSKAVDQVGNETKTDSISFSEQTKDLQKISKAMETESVDRKKYVADIKQTFETNQYTINAETIADKLVGSIMNEMG